jgi:hypothetical protein
MMRTSSKRMLRKPGSQQFGWRLSATFGLATLLVSCATTPQRYHYFFATKGGAQRFPAAHTNGDAEHRIDKPCDGGAPNPHRVQGKGGRVSK